MRRLLALTCLLASSCSVPGGGAGVSAPSGTENIRTDAYPTGDTPNWVGASAFYDPSERRLYALGRLPVTAGAVTACPNPKLLLEKAEHDGKERLSATFGRSFGRAERVAAYFDGVTELVVIVEAPGEPGGVEGITHLRPDGGARGPAMIEAGKAAAHLIVARSGVCADAHRRSKFECCGPTNTFCSDPTRFDRELDDRTCRCGNYDPCLHDFRCEERQGTTKCMCRGDSCPCTALIKCSEGQACADGRCF